MFSKFWSWKYMPYIWAFWLICFQCTGTSPEEFFKSGHTNNWAVLVDTSRFWFNYRHVANVLSIYRSCKRLGIPDRFGVFQYIHVQIVIVLGLICCILRNEWFCCRLKNKEFLHLFCSKIFFQSDYLLSKIDSFELICVNYVFMKD